MTKDRVWTYIVWMSFLLVILSGIFSRIYVDYKFSGKEFWIWGGPKLEVISEEVRNYIKGRMKTDGTE